MSDQLPSQPPLDEPGREAPAPVPTIPASAPGDSSEAPAAVPPPVTGQSPASPPPVPPTPPPGAPTPAPVPPAAPSFGTTEPGPPTYEPQSSARSVASNFAAFFPDDRPEIGVGAAFAGGLVLALILKRLGH